MKSVLSLPRNAPRADIRAVAAAVCAALAAWALYRLTPLVSAVDFGFALALLAGGTAALCVAEWRAKRLLAVLVECSRRSA